MPPDLFARVALDTPLTTLFDYRVQYTGHGEPPIVPGQLVQVPFGRRQVVGVVWEMTQRSEVPSQKIRSLEIAWRELPPLPADWRALMEFAARYYQRALGEVALPALPTHLRSAARWPRLLAERGARHFRLDPRGESALLASLPARAKARRRLAEGLCAAGTLDADEARALCAQAPELLHQWAAQGWVIVENTDADDYADAAAPLEVAAAPRLTDEQQAAFEAIDAALRREDAAPAPFLLHGVTGSGKTEVYLHAVAAALLHPGAQVLVLVPEINLTPQLEQVFRRRFPKETLATLHSGLAEGERARHWLAAHRGRARIVLGTRLAVLASLPHLRLIVVDEEHDPSYKQQESLRYSARDLAVWRAHQRGIPIVLGSATPSLDSWRRAQQGRYRLLTLRERASPDAVLPEVRLIDLQREGQAQRALEDGLAQPLLGAVAQRLARGQQSLLFLNRRGYAPVLACDACGWISGCPRCSAHLVLHKSERRLRCHHCGLEAAIPRACPDCGNLDLAPLGRGTQRIEETLARRFPNARIARIDADSTRRKGSAQALFDEVHAGAIDILVGTQMVAKGHDFRNVTLVGVINADAALFSHDFRAGERLFSQLMQVSGRAGRAGQPGEVLIQTRYADHPLYAALLRHDYAGFAAGQLAEREQASLPPFTHQALLRAEARALAVALEFLQTARDLGQTPELASAQVTLYDPVPMTLVRVANSERAQLLVESPSRPALQQFLSGWVARLRDTKTAARWYLEVDPLDI
ncbi:primosomal protein N' [Pandoraea thiooxydans]|uniref:primosomal protein N' n=1 Tax=Pandoraea thiooxydans TaxID=445709 RepID=UPI000A5085AC|nr:primosomal protein N' [Pandoraea thiooxydans]